MSRRSVVVPGVAPPFFGAHATRADDICFCAVTAPPDPDGLNFETQFARGAATVQSAAVLDIAERSLGALGSSLAKGLKIDQFCAHPDAAAAYLAVRAQKIATDTRPSSTHVQVAGLANPEALIGVQLIAYASSREKEPIVVPGMPASPGKPFKPAPHALVYGDLVFVTGQVAYDFDEGYPAAAETDGMTWYQSKALNEAKYVIGKIEKIMRYLGGSLADTIKLEIYLNDLADVVDVERVLKDAYGDARPVRSYMSTVRLAPTRCRVEITAICRRTASGLKMKRLSGEKSWSAPWLSPIAVECGGLIFTTSLAGYPDSRLENKTDVGREVRTLIERAAEVRSGGLRHLLFGCVQVSAGTSLDDVRSALGGIPEIEDVALSISAARPPMLWRHGNVQADFVLAAA